MKLVLIKKYNLAVNQILKTLILLLAFAFVGCSNNKNDVVINDPEQYDLVKDIIWASPEGFDLTLDIYSPKSEEKLPVLIIYHGGGWLINDKSIMDQMSQYIATNSKYVVCNVNYRLLSDKENSISLHEIVEDAFGALLWVNENIHKYNGDNSKIAVTGDSAGAHLAAMIVNLGEEITDEGDFSETLLFKPTYMPKGNTLEEIKSAMAVQASILSYGAFDIYNAAIFGMESSSNPFWYFSGSSPRGIFGDEYTHLTHPDMYKKVSPIFHIPSADKKSLPPQYLIVGSEDALTTPELVSTYQDKLLENNQPADLWIYDGKGHAFLDSGTNFFLGNRFDRDAPKALDQIIGFLDEVLE